MKTDRITDFKIINTNAQDWEMVIDLFNKANGQQGQDGYKVWGEEMDRTVIEKDIESGRHYKIATGNDVLCIFSVQYTDSVIWREKDKNDALYLHRVVVNPVYKGQKQFMKVLNWAKEHALQKGLKFIRMDTWAENTKLTDYYRSYGFEVAEYYTTPNEAGIPIQYRNVEVVLFEMEL